MYKSCYYWTQTFLIFFFVHSLFDSKVVKEMLTDMGRADMAQLKLSFVNTSFVGSPFKEMMKKKRRRVWS